MVKKESNGKAKKAGPVNVKDLVRGMLQIIERGERDTKKNVEDLAKLLGITELTCRQKIRDAKSRYPQIRQLDLTYFVATPGKRKETVDEDELNNFMAEVLQKPIEEVEAEVEEAKAEIEAEEAKREERRQKRQEREETELAST